ncbi:hypothetical protein ABIF66_006471 [Bradyrhizobium japonicum]
MPELSRRHHLQQLSAVFGSAALSGLSRPVWASEPDIPPEGIGKGIKHISYSDVGGRPDTVQVMFNRQHVYVGHMFSDGVTILDASDPRALKPVNFFTAGQYTRTHHLQVAEDLLLLANGANIVAMQSYDSMRGYFENSLADSITKAKKFRSGLSIHDISKPGEMREVAFLEMPGFGINRLWWPGGRYAYVSAHFDGFADHILCVVDLKTITKPEIVAKWWLPGMNRAAGEPATPKGKRFALHHMITAGDRGYAAWRDGGFTIHDIGDPANPKLLSHINWSPPFAGGTHTPLPLPKRQLAIVADEANADQCAKGLFHTFVLDVCARRKIRCRSRRCRRHAIATSVRRAPSVRIICMRTAPAPSRARRRFSRPTTMPAPGCLTSGISLRRRRSRIGCRRHRKNSSTPARTSRSQLRPAMPMSGPTV